MAHEGVDANTEQVWDARKVGNWRVGSVSTCKSVKSSIETIVRDVRHVKHETFTQGMNEAYGMSQVRKGKEKDKLRLYVIM